MIKIHEMMHVAKTLPCHITPKWLLFSTMQDEIRATLLRAFSDQMEILNIVKKAFMCQKSPGLYTCVTLAVTVGVNYMRETIKWQTCALVMGPKLIPVLTIDDLKQIDEWHFFARFVLIKVHFNWRVESNDTYLHIHFIFFF